LPSSPIRPSSPCPRVAFASCLATSFAGKILVDAMNYWPDVDGDDEELAAAPDGTSTVVQDHFPDARVVKALNQLGY
jgi:predicted dinucleotide-binding enzyme